MKRKTSTVPTKIWTFGCEAPTVNAEAFNEQLFLANRYYNMLTEIERDRRKEFRAARSEYFPELAELEREAEVLAGERDRADEVIKKLRAAARKKIACPAEQQALKDAKDRLKEKRRELAETRARCNTDEVFLKAAGAVDEKVNERVKQARAASGVYWGTYLLVERAAEASKRDSREDPKFKKFFGEGRVGVQLQKTRPLSTAGLFEAASTMISIRKATDARTCLHDDRGRQLQDSSISGGQYRRGRRADSVRAIVRLRIGKSTWCELPVFLHRELPEGELKWAWIKVRKIGRETTYELQLTVESESFRRSPVPAAPRVAALDIGWRAMPDGVRVGYLVSDRGETREIRLPSSTADAQRHLDRLRGYRDEHFDVARAEALKLRDKMPEAKFLEKWRSPRRLENLIWQWIVAAGLEQEDRRFWATWKRTRLVFGEDLSASPEKVRAIAPDYSLAYLSAWRHKSLHLGRIEETLRAKVLGRRKEIYRRVAADLSRGYDVVVVEAGDKDEQTFMMNLCKFAQDDSPVTNHRMRDRASPSELRDAVKQRLEVRTVPAENSTREHYECGFTSTWKDDEAKKSVRVTCEGCGKTYDQDENAARVLLKRYFEQLGGGENAGGARSSKKDAA